MGRLAAARLAVLPFAPALWLYAWLLPTTAKRLTQTWPRWFRVPLFALLFAGGLVGILTAQMNLYTRMTGIRVLQDDNYFFALLVAELFLGGGVILAVAYREQQKGKPGGAK